MVDHKSESSEDDEDILDLKNDEGCKYHEYVSKNKICAFREDKRSTTPVIVSVAECGSRFWIDRCTWGIIITFTNRTCMIFRGGCRARH